jgi:hypothetical protein
LSCAARFYLLGGIIVLFHCAARFTPVHGTLHPLSDITNTKEGYFREDTMTMDEIIAGMASTEDLKGPIINVVRTV